MQQQQQHKEEGQQHTAATTQHELEEAVRESTVVLTKLLVKAGTKLALKRTRSMNDEWHRCALAFRKSAGLLAQLPHEGAIVHGKKTKGGLTIVHSSCVEHHKPHRSIVSLQTCSSTVDRVVVTFLALDKGILHNFDISFPRNVTFGVFKDAVLEHTGYAAVYFGPPERRIETTNDLCDLLESFNSDSSSEDFDSSSDSDSDSDFHLDFGKVRLQYSTGKFGLLLFTIAHVWQGNAHSLHGILKISRRLEG